LGAAVVLDVVVVLVRVVLEPAGLAPPFELEVLLVVLVLDAGADVLELVVDGLLDEELEPHPATKSAANKAIPAIRRRGSRRINNTAFPGRGIV
jgi:hypothetical protein